MTERSKQIAYALFALAVAASLALSTGFHLTARPILKDAAQNLRGAYYLVHAGTIGDERSGTLRPNMRREPLPLLLIAATLALHPAFAEPYSLADVADGRLTATVKWVNAFWRFVAVILIFLLCRELFGGFLLPAVMATICVATSEIVLFARPAVVDHLCTELPTAAILLLASWCAVKFVNRTTVVWATSLGLALGLLALTKASFFYIGIVFVVLLLALDLVKLYRGTYTSWRTVAACYTAIVLAMSIVIGPWIARNYMHFGEPQIASHGEHVFAIRTLLVERSLSGILYLSSPTKVRDNAVGPLTGYTPADTELGGRLHDLATVRERRYEEFERRMAAKGYMGSPRAWQWQFAKNYVFEHPIRYIASIPVFAYKGMWIATKLGAPFNILLICSLLSVFVWALVFGNRSLVAALGLSVGCFAFISMFSHALVRYNAPVVPIAVIAMLWLSVATANRLREHPLTKAFHLRVTATFHTLKDSNSASQRRPTMPTSSPETASRA